MGDRPRLTREQIAQRAAQELTDGACVNLGWGIPNLIADYLPKGVTVYFHSENGILGMGGEPSLAKKTTTWWTR